MANTHADTIRDIAVVIVALLSFREFDFDRHSFRSSLVIAVSVVKFRSFIVVLLFALTRSISCEGQTRLLQYPRAGNPAGLTRRR